MGWIGVDLDGTLAHYEEGQYPEIGEPLEPMLKRVRGWLDDGQEVRIVTARAAHGEEDIERVHAWLEKVGLPKLQVSCQKDTDMEVLWDDRAVQVKPNTGEPIVDGNLQESLARTIPRKTRKKTDSNSFELMASLEKDSKGE